jgi:leucyl aminopeptidase
VLSTVATDIAKNYPNFSCQILGQSECESLGMGGYLAVQQGSKFPPQFIHLTYTSASQSENKRKKVALVGKGLTFDSGGYNLKVGLILAPC